MIWVQYWGWKHLKWNSELVLKSEGQFLKAALMGKLVTWASGNVIHSFIALHAQINCS